MTWIRIFKYPGGRSGKVVEDCSSWSRAQNCAPGHERGRLGAAVIISQG